MTFQHRVKYIGVMAIRVKLKRMQKKSAHQNITYSLKQQVHQSHHFIDKNFRERKTYLIE